MSCGSSVSHTSCVVQVLVAVSPTTEHRETNLEPLAELSHPRLGWIYAPEGCELRQEPPPRYS